uniref:Uncharacterized protein n=1 Tax=Arundo donax TaxID=35708 RepID=A0A0A9ADB0_ARUDO
MYLNLYLVLNVEHNLLLHHIHLEGIVIAIASLHDN